MRGGLAWKLALAAVVLAIVPCTFVLSRSQDNSVPFLIGYHLIHSLVTFGLFYAVFLRRRSGIAKAICFCAIYLAFIAGAIAGATRLNQDARHLIGSLEALTSNGQSGAGSRSGGDFAEIERYLKEVADNAESQRKDYLQELEAVGWTRLLDANRVAGDSSFAQSRAILTGGAQIVQRRRMKTDVRIEQMREMLDQLKINNALKRGVKDGFEQSMPETMSFVRQIWDLEESTVGEFEHIIDLLSSRRHKWRVQNGRFVFSDAADLRRFNSYVTNIQDYAAQEKTLDKQRIEGMQKNIAKMKELLK